MSKTPEEMAEEWATATEQEFSLEEEAGAYKGFLAGYKAAQDSYKDAIKTYEDVAKQMLEEAVRIMTPRDQLADADKVMPQWISVKDRLPNIGDSCLVTCHEARYTIAEYDGIKWTTLNSIPYYHPIVTHWQWLPEIPKEEE